MYIVKINQMKVDIPVPWILWDFVLSCFSYVLCVSFCFCLGDFQMSWMPRIRNPQAFQTAYATGTLSGMLGADDVWVGGTMRARGQKLGLIAEDRSGESSFRWVGWYIVRFFSGRSAPVCQLMSANKMMFALLVFFWRSFFDEVVLMVSKHVGWSPLF